MAPSPIFEAPLVRALLRTLLFTVILEALFYRLLTIPAGARGLTGWDGLAVSTGRAGALMFFLAFVLLIPTLITVAYATLRHPAWPGGFNGFISIGLLTLSALAVSASLGPRGPAFAVGFNLLGLSLSLAMLASFYDRCGRRWARWFAVALGGAILTLSLAEVGGLTATLGLTPRLPLLITSALSGGWWLLFAAGALAFFAFEPGRGAPGGPVLQVAAYGLPAATAFGLAFGVIFEPSLLSRLAPALGAGESALIPEVLRTTAAGAALFLVGVTALRGMGTPSLRPASIGLLLLLLAGYPREVAYQHLVSILGIILITGTAPPLPPRSPEPGSPPSREPARPPGPPRTVPVRIDPPGAGRLPGAGPARTDD